MIAFHFLRPVTINSIGPYCGKWAKLREIMRFEIKDLQFSFLGLSNFVPVAPHDGLVWPAGLASSSLECEIPEDWGDDRAVLATRPNEIQLTAEGGYRTRIKNRVFLGDYVEYRMDIGDTEIRVQTHEHRHFRAGDVCGIRLGKVKWYPAEDEVSDEERERRKVI